ncbi:MAG: photosystem II repair protein Psb32 [Synechococcaceae cyanobacterium]
MPFLRSLSRLVPAFLLAVVLLTAPLAPVLALSLADLPAQPPASRVLDAADVLSIASRTEIEKQLQQFGDERVDARLVTVGRLDYGLTLPVLADQLLARWSQDSADDTRLLILIDSQTKSAAIAASAALERQLPSDLLRSTARTTMALPLREGNRYRQASLDGLTRLATVLRGGEDPGEPVLAEDAVVSSNIPTREETASSNAFTWVVVLLVVGTIVPMLTWWVFSR